MIDNVHSLTNLYSHDLHLHWELLTDKIPYQWIWDFSISRSYLHDRCFHFRSAELLSPDTKGIFDLLIVSEKHFLSEENHWAMCNNLLKFYDRDGISCEITPVFYPFHRSIWKLSKIFRMKVAWSLRTFSSSFQDCRRRDICWSCNFSP